MKSRHLLILVVGLLVGLLSVSAGLAALPLDRSGTVTPDSPFIWLGATASGANTEYSAAAGEPCGKTPLDYCDVTLIHVNVDPSYWDTHGGGVMIRLHSYFPSPASDFDLYIYQSDASGARGALVGSSPNFPGEEESFTIQRASGYYLVQVVYFAVTESRYTGQAQFVSHAQTPPDVDSPAGLQEVLASDPALGFRSHSEPHIAQSPLHPDILVAGSKMYNRDPDSLPEYEFKIGTYVSFDGGQTWTDLGQLGVCPPEQAPPSSWPNNTCYPDEDPNRGGTGPEDDNDPRGNGDFGEEYITSDIWIHMDDEGNAYAMVLDAPPFPSGVGWGMSLHIWESVSPEDLVSGETWSERIPINFYPDEPPRDTLGFLDDKNTFAINNAGPDGDGETGTMIACWGQNISAATKQLTVCKRSVDGGRTWPGEPVPISPPTQQLVIGVHVVADPNDPDTFYAVWLHYVPGLVGAADEYWVAKTINGGLTWLPPVLAAQVNGIPRQFPGQSFRNLSIPIMAAGPAGELYIAYADYRAAPQPGDIDGRQADIMVIRSTNGGLTWSAPASVNQDNTNADQFQPYVAVSPDGEVVVSYFDRRHDPENFFIDTFLSRSKDEGETFADTRLSHDMWDPSINPPVSGSGDFIGDYQGLVVDRCFIIPFVNDTHLANNPGRDADFDAELPRSIYQEVFSWRVPTGNCPSAVTLQVTGGGEVPGSAAESSATFGINVRSDGSSISGRVRVFDQGTGAEIQSESLASISRDGNRVTILGTCSINGGMAQSCEVQAVDNGEPGRGQDQFFIKVGLAGSLYSAGGTLERGNVQVK